MAAIAIGNRLLTRAFSPRIYQLAYQKQNANFIPKLLPLACTQRSYRGSNRMKRLKASRQHTKLEKELEIEYGISNKVEFNFREWMKKNYSKEMLAFQNRIGVKFFNEKVLVSAFAHASFCDEIEPLIILSNTEDTNSLDIQYRLEISKDLSHITSEKLSLLGFEISSTIIKEHLYNRYNNLTKAICNDVWTFLTSRDVITSLAKNIGLEDLVLMSRELEGFDGNFDDELQLNFTKDDILSDTLFALIGAIHVDQGNSEVKSFVEDFLLPHLDHTDLTQYVNIANPHEELTKVLSINGINSTVRARTIIETGVDSHFPFYRIGIFCQGLQIGDGTGHSTSIARTNAFENTVFKCLENEVDFTQIKRR